MAWNKYYVFVTNQHKIDLPTILPALGLSDYQVIGEVDLNFTNKPKTLFITHFNDCLLLIHPSLVFDFFKETPSETEKSFIRCFPNSEIAAIYHNETVNGYGYTIINRGERQRVNFGSDGDVHLNFGNLLEEEISMSNTYSIDEEELEELTEDMEEYEIQSFIQFLKDVGIPVLLTARYFGVPVHQIDPSSLKFTQYELRPVKQ